MREKMTEDEQRIYLEKLFKYIDREKNKVIALTSSATKT